MNNFKDGKREVKWGAKRKHLGRKAMTGFVAMLLFVMTLLPTSVMADSGNGGGDLGNASAAADVIPASEPETTNGDKNWIHCDSPDGSSQHRSGQARNDSDSNKDWIAGQARNDSNDSNDGNDGNDSEIDFQSLDISDGSIFSALALLADEGLGALSGEDLVIGALAAPADVTLNSVTATNVAGASGDVYTYNTWTTSPATGDFRLNVNFQFANGIATLGDVKLKVKLTSAQAAFATSNAYVVTSSPANAYIDETNLAIDGDGNLSLNFKQGTSGSAGSVIIAFPFNHTLDGWLSGYTTTGETFANFEVFTESGGATGTATSVTVGSSATIRGSGVDLYSRTPAEHVLVGSDMTLQPRFFDRYTDEWRHEPNSIVTFTMDYPNGATVLDAVGGTVNTGNHTITWSYTADSVTGIIPHSASGWSSSPMAYVFMPTVRINFPASAFATVNDEDDVVLKLKSESYFVGKTEQYVITSDDYEFKVFNTDSVLAGIRMKNAAFQYSGGPHIIKNISTVSSGASALGNLGNGNMGLWNVGLKPIPNTCVIWRNNSDATKKINVFSVQARNGGTTPPSRIEFYVCNSDGSHAESKWPTSINLAFYSAYNISDLNLSNGQYIEMIKSYPQYNPDTGNIDALPVGASAGLVVNFTGFSDGKYPDGTLIGNGDELSWSLEGVWEGETKVEDFAGLAEYSYEPSTKISSMKYEGKDEQKIFYCAPVPSPTAQMHITSSTTVAPRDLMNVNLRFYNSTAGNPMGPRTVWENPTFVILPPDGLSFDPADNTNLVAYKPNDDVWSNDVEVSETTRNGRTVYIVTVKGELAALDSWSYIKDLKFTVKDDAPIGANTIASYRDEPTFNTERNGFVFATSETPNNLVPDNVIPFAGTVYRGFVSDTSLQSGGWDANVNTNFIGRPPSNGGTISFNVSPLPSVDVRAEMYDTEVTGDADPWKNVSSNVEVPTVLGDSAQMRLVIENAGNTFLGNLRLLDILPKIGDKLVLAPGTEKGSTWDAFMGAIDIQVENIKTEEIISGAALATAYPGFAVQYCKNNNPSINNGVVRTGTGGNFANDAAGDPTEAGSFFFTMGANKLPPGYRIILNFEITAPTSAALDDISAKAFNSFAYLYTNYNDASGNGADAKSAIETTTQSIVLADSNTSTIGNGDGSGKDRGVVFRDLNKNGLLDSGETFSGVTVELYAEDKENVGNPLSTPFDTKISASDGTYEFTDLPAGHYWIKALAPEKPDGAPASAGYSLVAQGVSGASSHVNQTTGLSDMITVHAGVDAPDQINAGIKANAALDVKFVTVDGFGVSHAVGSSITINHVAPGAVTVTPKSGDAVYPIPAGYHIKKSADKSGSYNFSWDDLSGTLTFELVSDAKTSISLSAGNASAAFNGNTQDVSSLVSLISGKLLPGHTLVLTNASGSGLNAGSYPIDIGKIQIRDALGNLVDISEYYDVKVIAGTFTIKPISITVKPRDEKKVYDGSALVAKAVELVSGSGKLLSGHTLELGGASFGGAQTEVGASSSSVSGVGVKGTSAGNYIIGYAGGKLEVTAGEPLVVTPPTDDDTAEISYVDGGEGVTGIPSGSTVRIGERYTIPSVSPSRDGYAFGGWTVIVDGVSRTYHGGDSFVVRGDTVLVAIWTEVAAAPTPTLTVSKAEEPIEATPEPEATVNQAMVVSAATAAGIPILPGGVPLYGPAGFDTWALLDLILAIAGVILLLFTLVMYIRKSRREEAAEENYYGDEEDEHRRNRRPLWLVITVILAIVAVVLFVITQDMRLPMVFVDGWTIVFAILFVVEVIASKFTSKRVQQDEEEDRVA